MILTELDLITAGMVPAMAEYLTDMGMPKLELIDGIVWFDGENQLMTLPELVTDANGVYAKKPNDFIMEE